MVCPSAPIVLHLRGKNTRTTARVRATPGVPPLGQFGVQILCRPAGSSDQPNVPLIAFANPLVSDAVSAFRFAESIGPE
jgi:hypothetical protein